MRQRQFFAERIIGEVRAKRQRLRMRIGWAVISALAVLIFFRSAWVMDEIHKANRIVERQDWMPRLHDTQWPTHERPLRKG